MTAYFNEIDEKAAAWLRELIRRDLIAPGDVDTRSIEDVSPDDLRPYTQCHFFAGIGVWSYALRLAGWPDDRPVWTGSCPCQPFSAAGKGGGFADERHLWPAQFHLIRERRPVVWLGEQVASKDGLAWLDLVQADLEGEGYAVGAVDTCSAGFGAPHIRQRLRIAATRVEHAPSNRRIERRAEPSGRGIASGCGFRGLAEPDGGQRGGLPELRGLERDGPDAGRAEGRGGLAACGDDGRLADGFGPRLEGQRRAVSDGGEPGRDRTNKAGPTPESSVSNRLAGWQRVMFASECDPDGDGWCCVRDIDPAECDCVGPTQDGVDYAERDGVLYGRLVGERPGPVNGFWRAADWLFCRDGKWRPVEPGTFPLAHGAPARVGRLRGYGNAVDAIATKEFIEAADEAFDDLRLMSDLTTDEGVFG